MAATDLDMELIRCFLGVAVTRNFTAAARKLHRTQSAVSMRIRRLEEVLGCKLLERSSRHVALTPDGELFLPHAARLLALNDEALGQMRAGPASTSLRVGIVEYLAPQQLPAMLAAFRRSSPQLRLEVRLALSAPLLEALDSGEIDVAIAKADPRRPGGLHLWREQMAWTCADALADPVRPARVPLLLLQAPCAYRAAALDALARARIAWDEVLTTSSIHGVEAAIRSGLGYTVLGRSALQPGMRVLQARDGWPELPAVELAAYGTAAALAAAQPLVEALRAGWAP
jgi:DNA-binding transcriptional LysR family regulator